MSSFILRTILCSSLFAVGLCSLNSHDQQHSTIRGSQQSPNVRSTTTTSTTTRNKNGSTLLPPLKATRSGGKSTRIVGGQNANPGWYPYMVSLQDSSGGHICGGSLVAPDIVVSASHCAGGITTVVVGATDLSDYSSGSVETFGVKNMYLHPDYSDVTLEYDVMVIKLDGQATVADPVRINNDYSVPSPRNVLTVLGWGGTSEDGYEYPNLLQEANLFYVPNRICKNIVDDDGSYYGSDLTNDMMCAAAEDNIACYGDSGGPLLLLGASPAEDVQVGIVSWGGGWDCAGPLPVVYQRLPFSFQWIQSLVCSRSAAPPAYFNC